MDGTWWYWVVGMLKKKFRLWSEKLRPGREGRLQLFEAVEGFFLDVGSVSYII